MQPLIIRSSRLSWRRYFIFGLACAFLGVALIVMKVSTLWGWAFIAFGFFTIATFGKQQQRDRRPRISIDDQGIVYRRYGLIEWSDIEGAYLNRGSAPLWLSRDAVRTFICLRLRDSKKYTDRLPPMVRRMIRFNALSDLTPVFLDVTGTDISPEDILHLIESEVRARSNERAMRTDRQIGERD